MLPILIAAQRAPDPARAPVPVFALGLDGALRLRKGRLTPLFRPGTGTVSAAGYTGFRFDGRLCGIQLGDPPVLRLTRSLSIACMVRLESYVQQGPGAQIVFRGDDRSGLDPYSLTVLSDGRVYFSVENGRDEGDHVSAPIPLHRWTHVLGSLDDRTGGMTLWIDGVKVDAHSTKVRPFGDLDLKFAPGVSIGNIQNDRGPFNQPLDGLVANVGIYDQVVTPAGIRLNLEGWDRPVE